MGGRCLSNVYEGNKAHYYWECGQCQNQWQATWNNVKSCGSWCPECKTSIGESTARAAFQENFPGEEFGKNRTAIGMELDGYSEKLCLAFEYDGIQHREHVPHFQREEGAHEAQLGRDARKDELCEEADITLIRIPDKAILPIAGIRAFVRNAVIELGYDVPDDLPDDASFLATVRAARGASPYLNEAKDIVEAAKGELLGEGCPTRTWPLHIRCQLDHVFVTHYDNLVRGRWCPRCAGTATKTDGEVEEAASRRGYEFLHTESRVVSGRSRRYVTLQCPNASHEPIEMLWDNFQKGRGCQACGRADAGASRRAGTDSISEELSGLGLTLEGEYRNRNAQVTFACDEGHVFTSSVNKVKLAGAGNCCPECVIGAMEGVELVGEYGPDVDPTKTTLEWRCVWCRCTFKTTYRGLRIRKKLCRNPKCPGPN